MAIYTRKGDKGRTSLFNKQKVYKYDIRVEAYGTVDELNSAIGLVQSSIRQLADKIQKQSASWRTKFKIELENIQNDLLEIGSSLANPAQSPASPAGRSRFKARSYLAKRGKEFENFIDEMTEKMPKLQNFILPGGGRVGAELHLARAISRRAERRVVRLNSKEKIDRNILIYLNRLSDLFFTMSRFANFKERKKETIWKKKI
jgi:cob(I)alamin adenosyltransferase